MESIAQHRFSYDPAAVSARVAQRDALFEAIAGCVTTPCADMPITAPIPVAGARAPSWLSDRC